MMRGRIKGSATVYPPYTLALPFIFPYTLGCMAAGKLMLQQLLIDLQLPGKHWLIESLYKSAVPCTGFVPFVQLYGFALGNTYNYTQGTNPTHPRNPWYNYYIFMLSNV